MLRCISKTVYDGPGGDIRFMICDCAPVPNLFTITTNDQAEFDKYEPGYYYNIEPTGLQHAES